MVDTIIVHFQERVKKPERFLRGDNSLSQDLKINLKHCYDSSKLEYIINKSNILPELIIQKFDLEQIWQQIELQNDELLTNSIKKVSGLIVRKDRLLFTHLENKLKDESTSCSTFNIENESDESIANSISETESNEISFDENDLDELKETDAKTKKAVDDECFKLDNMEEFLRREEKKFQNEGQDDSSNESSKDEEAINMFENNSDSDDDKVKTARFKDFFVAAGDKKTAQKRVIEEIEDEENDHDKSRTKSSFEMRLERAQNRILHIEQANISEKPWQLKGEITADKRPQNSLLEEIVEFDLTSRPAPTVTEQTTLQLEDIIKQRIKDATFDSVVRKEKAVELPTEFKKIVLDQEKSKQSLAQIYEQEFLDRQASVDPDNIEKEIVPDSHKEIKCLMKNLFHKLDSLSNFHFTPKLAIPELRVINNLSAISTEEVAPVATSDSALLAPQEVKSKVKGNIVGKQERTNRDKKRERRKKKQKQHMHAKEKQKQEKNAGKPHSNRLLQQVTKNRNTGKIVKSAPTKNITSSKAFFTQLQEEVQTQIKVKSKKQTDAKTHLIAKKVKL